MNFKKMLNMSVILDIAQKAYIIRVLMIVVVGINYNLPIDPTYSLDGSHIEGILAKQVARIEILNCQSKLKRVG